VFSWGWNEHGQLGVGDEANRYEKTFVLENKAKTVLLGCGAGTTLLVFSSNEEGENKEENKT
jgi:alpha-tubulin suppressor-like RCC1 family protein